MNPAKARSIKAQTRPVQPTLTDQSQAHETDINVIVKRFLVSGTAPGAKQEPLYEDFTGYPGDLRGFIERSRALQGQIDRLPEQLRGLTVQQLMALQPNELADILKPPATPPDDTGDKK